MAWRGKAEQVLQPELAGRRVEQVGAAHHVGGALRRIVHDHRELVGEDAVRPVHDEVADIAFQVLFDTSAYPVVEGDRAVVDAYAPGAHAAPGWQAAATGPGIDRALDADMRRGRRDFGARAGAGVCMAGGDQGIERRAVCADLPALHMDLSVPGQAESFERATDRICRARPVARRVEVFDAQQPFATRGAGVEPACQCRHQRAEVERAGGRRCKTPSVIHPVIVPSARRMRQQAAGHRLPCGRRGAIAG